MLSFTLPRFCDQSLDRSRKERFYPGAEPWIAKLDTVVHELYHIDPELAGIRRIEKEDGTYSANCHGHRFFEQVAEMVHAYLEHQSVAGGLRFPARRLRRRSTRDYGGIVGTSFRTFPSFPQRYIERLAEQLPCESDAEGVKVEPLRVPQQPTRYTQDDLHVRQFMKRHVAPPDSKGRVPSRVEFSEFRFVYEFQFIQFDAPCAEEARRPVARAEALDAHDAGRARRVDELIAADRDRDVRRPRARSS